MAKRAGKNDERVTRAEHQLAVAQRITHIGSWEWDIATNSVAWSDELYRIYGLEPGSQEISLEFFLSRLHPGDRDRVAADIRVAVERGERFAYPERIVRPDGSIRDLDTVGDVVRDAEGRAVSLIGTCRDVTDERRRDETLRIFADIVQNVRIGLSVWDMAEGQLRLVTFNPAAEKLAHRPLGTELGKSLREILPFAAGGQLEGLLETVAREGGVHEATVSRSRDPHDPTRALAIKAFPLPGRRVGVAIEDVTAITKTRRLQDAECRVLEMIGAGADLGEILTALILAIEEHSPATIGSILLLDADGAHVRHAAGPQLRPEFIRAIDGAAIGPQAGSCGTAAFLRQAVYVADIETDALWQDYRALARENGLRACWSTPVLATDGRVLGTFALYYREPRAPTAEDRALIQRATHLAGIAIQRRQLEDQLRALSAHVESVREDERTGIAREIHDELGQALTALRMDLSWLARRLSGESSVPAATLLEKIQSMSDMTDDVIQQVRRISSDLRPGVLDDLGLLAAVEWQAQEFEKRTGVPCTIRSNLDEGPLDRDLSTAVFRIFQEALTNVARHSAAEHVEVRLDRERATLRLEVRDDGKGITTEAARSPRSLGLLGIRERARRLGGSATVEGDPSGGTLVALRLPFPERTLQAEAT